MSGIKVFNTTGSAPTRILNIVCKEILDPHDRFENYVEPNERQEPLVEPTPALVQVPIDDYITSNVPWRSPQDPPNRTGLDIHEQIGYEDDDCEYEDDDIPRMPKGWNTEFDKNEDMDCDDNPFTVSCPPIMDSQTTKNKSPQHQTTNKDNEDVMITDFVPARDGEFRETLPNLPRRQRKAKRTTNMIGDGNCFFRFLNKYICKNILFHND